MPDISYPFDPTGVAASNLVQDEAHTITEINASTYKILIPTFAPFYLDNFVLKHKDHLGVIRTLTEDLDYKLCLPYIGATRSIGKMLYGGISMLNIPLSGLLFISYQTLGGEWTADSDYVLEALAEKVYNPRTTVWDVVTNKPNQFPPINHNQLLDYVYGYEELIAAVNALAMQVVNGPNPTSPMVKHLIREDNPHGVTKAQVGLGNVADLELATDQEITDNLEVDKYATVRQILALIINNAGTLLNMHVSNKANPHEVTKEQVGLGNVANIGTAEDIEVGNRLPVDKNVTLRQVLDLLTELAPQSVLDHLDDVNNPHNVTADQIGLGNVANLETATDEEVELRLELDKHVTLRQMLNMFKKYANRSELYYIASK